MLLTNMLHSQRAAAYSVSCFFILFMPSTKSKLKMYIRVLTTKINLQLALTTFLKVKDRSDLCLNLYSKPCDSIPICIHTVHLCITSRHLLNLTKSLCQWWIYQRMGTWTELTTFTCKQEVWFFYLVNKVKSDTSAKTTEKNRKLLTAT